MGNDIVYPSGKAKITAFEFNVPVGGTVVPHTHSFPVLIMIQHGEIALHQGGKSQVDKAGDELISKIKPIAKETNRKEVLGGLGGFGSLFEIPKKYKNPLVVSGTEGVGTKLQVEFALTITNTIGKD